MNTTNGKGECVLIADDEESVRLAMQIPLQANNYRVLTAENGVETLEICSQNPGQVHLVILDIMMPVMGGMETLAALRRCNPTLKVIISSGLITPEQDKLLTSMPVQGRLSKPFSLAQLLLTVKNVLNQSLSH